MAKHRSRRNAARAVSASRTTARQPKTRRATARAMAAAVPPTGAVSLEEARALAAVRSPAVAAGVVAPTPSPAEVGRARERRIREYTATFTITKRRGVKGLAAEALGAEPLQIFAEGDSWFDYPVPLFGGGIIPRLEKRIGVPILNLAKAGDEVRFMLGVTERKIIAAQFTAGCPADGPWDAMLFSGGGNDIVDNPMALWINDFVPNRPAAAQINQSRLDAALSIVRAGYEDLVSMRDALSPETHLFVHAYDFAIPDGRGVCHFGPWLKPTFDLRRFPDLPTAAAVVKVMLQQFAAMLHSLAASRPRMTVIDGQGTLEAVAKSWHNELHPAKAGFNAFADVFRDHLKQVFPNRLL
jgi:hypothetical protein